MYVAHAILPIISICRAHWQYNNSFLTQCPHISDGLNAEVGNHFCNPLHFNQIFLLQSDASFAIPCHLHPLIWSWNILMWVTSMQVRCYSWSSLSICRHQRSHQLRWDSNPQPPNALQPTRSPTRYPLRHGVSMYGHSCCGECSYKIIKLSLILLAKQLAGLQVHLCI